MTRGEDPAELSFEPLARAASSFRQPVEDDPAILNPSLFSTRAQVALLRRTFDWRDHHPLPPVRNQGPWNACYSFAAVAMIEARRQLAGLPAQRLIPGYIHNCRLGLTGPEYGSNADEVLGVCVAPGVAAGQDVALPVPPATCSATQLVRIAGWGWTLGQTATLNSLVTDGPVLVSMHVGPDFFTHRGSGVYALRPGDAGPIHAVLLIGYNLDAGWALVLHSGGRDWGESGVGRVQIGSGGLLTERSGAAARV